MDIRPATEDDQSDVREVAQRSLQASYRLSPQTIQGTVRQWYDDEEYAEKLDRDDLQLLVAEVEETVAAFTEVVVYEAEGSADLLWLHVHPDYRGEGLGSDLFETVRSRLDERDIPQLRGRVLSMNEVGTTFYENLGFEKVGEGDVEIADSTYTEELYVESEPSGLEPVTTDDTTVYVDRDNVDQGSMDVFHAVYSDRDRDELYGYYCGKCENLANAMDAMGRIECDACGNSRKPTRWDAAYM